MTNSSKDISSAQAKNRSSSSLATWCNQLEHLNLPSDYELMAIANLTSGHPWAFLADIAELESASIAYYRYLYGLARLVNPNHILEIGTAFGLSGASLIQGASHLKKFISLDLGVFSRQYELVEQNKNWTVLQRFQAQEFMADGRNIKFAQQALENLVQKIGSQAQLSFYQVNTQPEGSDNFDIATTVPHWFGVEQLVKELEQTPIDLLFIDGKHTDDGLYQDFKSFFPYVRPGGIIICDDLHDDSYPYDWAGQTLTSFNRILEEFTFGIEESFIWPFPQLSDGYGCQPMSRPFGLIRKRAKARLGFFIDGQEPLFINGLNDLGEHEVIQGLKTIKDYPALFLELEKSSLTDDQVAQSLVHTKNYPNLFSELKHLGLDDQAASQQLKLVENYPSLYSYLAGHPELVADLETFLQNFREHALMPKLGLMRQITWKALQGAYNLRKR